MTETAQAGLAAGNFGEGGELRLPVPSRRDYALYISDMSYDLARLAADARLPQEVGYCLRMAALAAATAAREPGSGLRRVETDT